MLDAAMSPIENDLQRLFNQTVTLIKGDTRENGTLSLARPSGRVENAKNWFWSLDDNRVIPFNEEDVANVRIDERIIVMKQSAKI